MPEYIVKTGEGRNLIIAADYYKQDTSSAVYNFYKSAEVSKKAPVLVGSVNSHAVLAVLEFEDAYQADFDNNRPFLDDKANDTEEDHDETCLDCRLEEFVNSESFFEEVLSIVDFYLSPSNQEDTPPEVNPDPAAELRTDIPATTVPDAQNYPIEHWRTADGDEVWGFQTTKGFVHFSDKEYAADGRDIHITYPSSNWDYKDLTGAARLED